MDVSILSKGESLATTWPKVGVAPITVAVNQAIVAAGGADWLAMLDAHKLRWSPVRPDIAPILSVPPRRGVFTAEAHMADAQAAFPGLEVRGSDHLERVGHPRIPCTLMAAIHFAVQDLGATALHMHGVDMQGTSICNDPQPTICRWPHEQKNLTEQVRGYEARGVQFHWYGAWRPGEPR